MSRRAGTHGNVIGRRTDSDSGRNGKLETLSAAALMALDLVPATPVVQGILYVGVTLFAGKPKIGKSWMMLALALAVATGSTIFGNTTVQQSEVLYLALEDNSRRLRKLRAPCRSRKEIENQVTVYIWNSLFSLSALETVMTRRSTVLRIQACGTVVSMSGMSAFRRCALHAAR